MATYIPNATQTTEPVESRTVESAALEFRTLKTSINARIEAVQDGNNAQDVRLTAIENALLSIGEGGLPGTVYVQRFSGTGAQTAFTLTATPQSGNVVDIYINGIYQNKDTFSVAGAVITFSEAPPAGTNNLEVQVTVTIALGDTDASLVSFRQAGTGAVARTAQDKMREWVSVKYFGAMGDGVTDDTAAIQNALNTGKAVYVPSGTYNISALIYTTANGQRVFGDGILQTVIQNITNNEPLFCFGDPRIASGATEFCTLEAITLHGKTDGTTLWGVYVPTSGSSSAGEYEGVSPSANNYYNGATSFTRATRTGTARGCTLRDMRIRYVYGGYALHVSSWGFGAYNVQLWSGQRGLRNSGAANSNHFVDLYISSMGREAIIHPDVPNSIPTACGYINAVVQQCGLDDSSLGTCVFSKGQGTYVSGIYLERNNEKDAVLATDVYVKVHEIGFVIDEVRHREESGGTDPLQTIIRTEGAGTRIGAVTFSSDVNEIVKVTGTDTDTSTFIFGPFSPVGTRTVTNGYINDTSTDKRTAVLFPRDPEWGFAISSSARFYAAAGKSALRNARGTTNVLALESGGPMRFSSDVNNETTGGDFTWEHNGQDGAGSLLLTLQTSNGNLYPGADNTQALGNAGSRWSTIYAGTGTINTSDAREKQQVRGLSDAERAVAVRLKSLIRTFKFSEAVDRKGDGARIHVGVIAQDVRSAFEAEGLGVEDYAIFCYDAWNAELDEDGNIITPAGERYGVRYEELLAFMIAAL